MDAFSPMDNKCLALVLNCENWEMLMKILNLALICLFAVCLNSCGKALSSPEDHNECGYRYVAGHECIVCEKGGVSCKW